jgi:hypothetical protein
LDGCGGKTGVEGLRPKYRDRGEGVKESINNKVISLIVVDLHGMDICMCMYMVLQFKIVAWGRGQGGVGAGVKVCFCSPELRLVTLRDTTSDSMMNVL